MPRHPTPKPFARRHVDAAQALAALDPAAMRRALDEIVDADERTEIERVLRRLDVEVV